MQRPVLPKSRADFTHKLLIVLKELNETRSCLESQELCWIVTASIKTRVAQPVQSGISDFGFEMQDSSNFKFSTR